MKRISKTTALLMLIALFIAMPALLISCAEGGDSSFVDMNMPYEPDTPAPKPHEGVFISEHGTMVFLGDGKSVTINFDGNLAEYLGLPQGEHKAQYSFMSGVLPPNGNMPVRYDVAHQFEIIVEEGGEASSALIDIGLYEDGSFHTGTNCTTEDRITFFVDWKDDGNWEAVDFLKEGQD